MAVRWGIHVAIGMEVLSVGATVVFWQGTLWVGLLRGLLSSAALLVGVLVYNLICEPFRRLSREVERLRADRSVSALGLAESFLELLGALRESVGSTETDARRQKILALEERLLFNINSIADERPKKWFYESSTGRSVENTIIHVLAREGFHLHRGDDKFLRNKLFELQKIDQELQRGE